MERPALVMRWSEIEVWVGSVERPWCRRQRKSAADDGYALLEEGGREGLKRAVEATSGVLRPGEMCCMMGPSGAGKTTLLSVLAARPQLGRDGYWTGEVLLNGRRPWRRWRRELAYVLQKDIFFESLTVREELEFAAALREAPASSVAAIVASFGLESVLDSKIGSSVERGLSGGELKRLNIATELLVSPRLALLDEPLTGLDSSRAHGILTALRDRAKAGTGVMLSVHMPTSKLWALFDRLLLLAPKGRVVYDGAARAASAYFEARGLPVPPDWNPPDHFIEVLGDDGLVAGLAWTPRDDRGDEPGDATPVDDPPRLAPFSLQVSALCRRAFVNSRGTVLKPLDWALVVSLAAIWGVLWFQVAKNDAARRRHASDVVSICFFFVAQWSWGPAFAQLAAFPPERDVLAKELASETYTIEAFFVAKQLAELPVSALLPAAFYAVVWPLVALPLRALPLCYLVSLLESWVAASLAQALSALIFDTEQTTTVLIIVQVFQMCCGGYFINIAQQPPAIAWLRFSSYWYYMSGLVLKLVVLPYDTPDRDLRAQIQGDDYSFSSLSPIADSALLFLYGFVFRIAAYLALKTSKKIRFS